MTKFIKRLWNILCINKFPLKRNFLDYRVKTCTWKALKELCCLVEFYNRTFFAPRLENHRMVTFTNDVTTKGACLILSKTMLFQPIRVRVVSELYYKSRSNVRLFGANHACFFNQSEYALYLNCIMEIDKMFAFFEKTTIFHPTEVRVISELYNKNR